MAFGFSTPGFNPQSMNTGFTGNTSNPNSILNAMMQTSPDYHSAQSFNQSNSYGGNMFGGVDGGGGGGGSGSGGGGGGGSEGASNAWGTSGQAQKISGLAGAADASITQSGINGRFGQVMPYLTGGLASAAGAGGSAIGQQTPITQGPVWTQQQIQQQVNNMTAGNNAQLGTQNKQAAQSLGGRGLGSNSPLLNAITGQNQMQNLLANTQGAQQINWNAAQGNAQQVLADQTQQEKNWSDLQNQDIGRRQINQSGMNAILAAMAGAVH